MAMRAMAESPALAQVCGIEVDAVVRAGRGSSRGALAALAGVFAGLTPQLHPEIGFNLLLALFAAAILGGTGSLAGAVVGGLLVGLAENLSLLVDQPRLQGRDAVPAAAAGPAAAAAGPLRRDGEGELMIGILSYLVFFAMHRADPRHPRRSG